MKNTIYPYPFKLSATGDLSDGLVFHIPSFCKSNHKTKNVLTFTRNDSKMKGKNHVHKVFVVK